MSSIPAPYEKDIEEAVANIQAAAPATDTAAPAHEHQHEEYAEEYHHDGHHHNYDDHHHHYDEHDPNEFKSTLRRLFGQNPCCCEIQRGFCVMVTADIIICFAATVVLVLDYLRENLAIFHCNNIKINATATLKTTTCDSFQFHHVDMFVVVLYYVTAIFAFIMDGISWVCPEHGRGFVLILSRIFLVLGLFSIATLFVIKVIGFHSLSTNLKVYLYISGGIFMSFGLVDSYLAWVAFAYSVRYKDDYEHLEHRPRNWWLFTDRQKVTPHPDPDPNKPPSTPGTYVNKIEINKVIKKHKHHHHRRRRKHSSESDHEIDNRRSRSRHRKRKDKQKRKREHGHASTMQNQSHGYDIMFQPIPV